MSSTLANLRLSAEPDLVAARHASRLVAGLVGFDSHDQTRIATAVSEIARHAVLHGGGGEIRFAIEGATAPQVLHVVIADRSGGTPDLDRVLEGSDASKTGLGAGIVGARRLMDRCDVHGTKQGTEVLLQRILPRNAPVFDADGAAALAERIRAEIRGTPQGAVEELQQQNRELLSVLSELRKRQDELSRLNVELADTNRGVLALYAELDEKAQHLRRADELKTKFLSNMSHEFRTPLNSILALAKLLVQGNDGELNEEQRKQVAFIEQSANELLELVNDLLDLAKVEAGKLAVRPVEFELQDLFGALRGMLRPLIVLPTVSLVFDDVSAIPALYTDESKVSQIVRNFISNALKFTERGEIRVSAARVPAGARFAHRPERAQRDMVVIAVSDTGIGIAPEDQERIFEEFNQIEGPLQRRVRGTGLGLPLCRRLARVLGGEVEVESAAGRGSTFRVTLPCVFEEPRPARAVDVVDAAVHDELPVIVIEDRADERHLIETHLRASGFVAVMADRLAAARGLSATLRPAAMILDISLRGEDSWSYLAELKAQEQTADVPVVVVTASTDERKARSLGADAFALKPVSREWLLETLYTLVLRAQVHTALIVDDDPAARYMLRNLLAGSVERILESADGDHALQMMATEQPDLVFLDLNLPARSGFEVLEALRHDPATVAMPVVVCTSRVLTTSERSRLSGLGAHVHSKSDLGRFAVFRSALRGVWRASASAWAARGARGASSGPARSFEDA